MILTILKYTLVFEIGFLVSMYLWDYLFYRPLKKSLHTAMDGWKMALDELQKVYGMVLTEKEPDGSVKSPFQISKD